MSNTKIMMMMKIFNILSIIPGVLSLNISIIGSGPSGKLASIILSKKGHNVSLYGKRDTRDVKTDDSFNFLLSGRGIDVLDKYNIDYKKDCKYTNKRINHYSHGNHFTTYTPKYESISRDDILRAMDNKIEDLDINILVSELIHLDIDEKTIHMSHGSETYDLLIGADGVNSIVRTHMLSRFKSEMSITTQMHHKTIKTMGLDVTNMIGYDPSWDNAVHVWNNKYDEVIAHPKKDGEMSCIMCVGDGVFEPSYIETLNKELGVERVQRTVTSSHVAMGSIVLVGDAAHSITLQSAESINAALEDCNILGEICDKHRHPYSICKNYNEKRVIDSHAVVEMSRDITNYNRNKMSDPCIPYSKIFRFNQD